jgi:DNA-binding HxlR family transcriptional regulator
MSPPRAEYVLTAKGRDLGPIVGAIRDWKYVR